MRVHITIILFFFKVLKINKFIVNDIYLFQFDLEKIDSYIFQLGLK